ncbi:unnamed protein product [Nyctereutes procyonoides]|uniref:(raccoon dog) hypothetical protein n=1 Tax=Nyctereutes procyonoides TaxID=34880 RepID=A0A811Z467_NYCPR|nr:unnamed protein product [Nyctereutes procyonoides]
MTETWDQGILSHLISTPDCQPLGCQASINFTFDRFYSLPPPGPNPSSDPIICFTCDQTHPNCQNYWVQTNGGCPYSYCNIHHLCQGPFTSPKYALTVPDPWDPCWATGVMAKLYRGGGGGGDQADPIRAQEQLLQTHLQTNPPQDQDPFSLVKLTQQGTSLANLPGTGSLSHCFICAALGKTPLVAPHTHTSGCLIPLSLNVPLFTDPLNHQFPFCYSTPNSSLCRVTQSNITSHHAPISGFFWCNGTLSKSLNTSASLLCLPVSLVPRLTIYSQAKIALLTIPPPKKQKRTIFLPLVVEVSLASAESLACLQHQITSLAGLALQNRCTLDLLTADKGGACMFLNEEVRESLQARYHPGGPTMPQWWQPPLTTWLLPLLSPLLIISILLMVAPCILQFIQEQVWEMSRVCVIQLLHPYSGLPTSAGPHFPPYISRKYPDLNRRPITTKG